MRPSSFLTGHGGWQKWLIAGALSLIIGFTVAMSPWLAVGLVVCLFGLVVLLRIKLHHLAWLIAFTLAFQFEYELGGVRLNWTELLALLLVVLLLFRSLIGGQTAWLALPYKALFVLYVFWGAIAHAMGPDIESPAQGIWHLYKTTIALPLLYLAAFGSIRKERHLKVTLAILIAAFCVSAGVGIVQTASGGVLLSGHGMRGNLQYMGIFPPYPSEVQAILQDYVGRVSDVTHVPGTSIFRAHGGMSNHNYFAVGLIIPCTITAGILAYSRSRRMRLLLGVAGLVQILGLILTFSRGGWVGLATSLGLVVLLVRKKPSYLLVLRTMALGGAVLVVLTILVILLPPPLLDRVTSIFEPSQAPEMEGRFDAWAVSVAEIQEKPVWGTGTSQVTGVTMFGHSVTSHNIFLSIAYERGLIGLLVFVLLLLFFLHDAYDLHDTGQGNTDPALNGLGVGMFAGLTGFVVAGMLASPILYPDTGALFWFSCGLLEAAVQIKRASCSNEEHPVR